MYSTYAYLVPRCLLLAEALRRLDDLDNVARTDARRDVAGDSE